MKAPNYIGSRGLYYLERLLWQNVAIIFLGMNTLWALLFWLRNDPKILIHKWGPVSSAMIIRSYLSVIMACP